MGAEKLDANSYAVWLHTLQVLTIHVLAARIVNGRPLLLAIASPQLAIAYTSPPVAVARPPFALFTFCVCLSWAAIVYPATGCDWFRDSDHRWVDCGLFWASPSSKGGCSWRPACVRKCLSLQNELVGTMRAVARMLARTTNTADRVRVLQSYMKGKGKVSESVQAYPTDYTL